MLSGDLKQKFGEKYKWKNAQKKADFYKNKRNQLRDWLGKLPDMLLILERLHPEHIKNIKLEDRLPDLIKFTDAFLDIANPLPVAECTHMNKKFVFQNTMVDATGSYLVEPQQEKSPFFERPLDETLIVPMDGRKCLMYTRLWQATKKEIQHCDVLKEHAEHLQRHIDPSVFVYCPNVPNDRRELVDLFESSPIFPDNRHEFIKDFMSGWQFMTPARNMPTTPPCKPRIVIDERRSLCEEDENRDTVPGIPYL